MFGNLVNKNARTALKEYGDHRGVLVDFDVVTQNSPNPQYTAVAKLGERSFLPATASTKKDAKEYAADLALQALSQGTVVHEKFVIPIGKIYKRHVFCFVLEQV